MKTKIYASKSLIKVSIFLTIFLWAQSCGSVDPIETTIPIDPHGQKTIQVPPTCPANTRAKEINRFTQKYNGNYESVKIGSTIYKIGPLYGKVTIIIIQCIPHDQGGGK